MKILVQLLALFASSILLSSCFEDPDCRSFRNNIVGISFKKIVDDQPDTVDIIGVSISNSDSVFSESLASAEIFLPLDVNNSQQTINFNLLKGTFSMVVEYQSRPQFESVDCGVRFILSDINVSEHNFDSVSVVGTTPLISILGTNIVVYSQ